MKLTTEEIALAEKMLLRHERDVHKRRHRWLGLTLAILVCVIGVFWLGSAGWLFHTLWTPNEGILGLEDASVASIRIYVEMQNLAMGGMLFALGMGVWLLNIGLISLLGVVHKWRSGPADLLVAKLLRTKWDEEKAAMAAQAPGED